MARLRPCTWAALLLFAQFCVAALAKKGATFGLETIKPGRERTVLQIDGSAELVERYFLHLEPNVSFSDVEYFQTSSHHDCLNLSRSMENVFATQTSHGTNVTSTLTFDNMVGVVKYTIGVRLKVSKKIIYSKTIKYIVCGMVLYQKNEDGSRTVLNTEGSEGFQISYQDAANKVVKDRNKIYCFIQYADGTSTDQLPQSTKRVPKGSTLLSSAPVVHQQFHHSSSLCDADAIGTYSSSTGIVLPQGCGFGFYWDANGDLCFGFNFEAYRSGRARLHFAWSGIAVSTGDLAEEIYECNMNVYITGTPPLAVLKVEPTNHLFRFEGGEELKCTFFNSDVHNVSKYRFQIGDSKFCEMVPGSLKFVNATDHTHSAMFVVKSGRGGPHKTVLQFAESNAKTSTTSTFKNAVMIDKFHLTYDERALFIENMSPISGNDKGGVKVTLLGYFASFRPDRDSIDFSGVNIPRKYVKQWSSHTIVFQLPPRSIIGTAFEYEVSVHVGNGVSNKVRFFYRVQGTSARISQSGTSYLRDNTYRVGNCIPLRFTLVLQPYTTKQIKKFIWTLKPANNTNVDLFNTIGSLQSIDTSQPTIEFHSSQIGPIGNFILTGTIVTTDSTIQKDIVLQRDNVASIGAFLLRPPRRYAWYPRSPMRIHAVVQPPGNCYKGSPTMKVEWTVFGKKYVFSAESIQNDVTSGYMGIQVSRLGRELIIPHRELTPGHHKIKFRVWMSNQTEIFGVAETELHIVKAKIVPVIRHGESSIQANWATHLNLFASNSYDPDIEGESRTSGITYKWGCNQSILSSFPEDETKPCSADILPKSSTTKASFTIPKEKLKLLGNYSYLRFFLSAFKNNDVQNATMDCQVLTGGTKPMLDAYGIDIQNLDAYTLPAVDTPSYEDIIVRPSGPNTTAWTYELVEPPMPRFKFFDLLSQSETLFTPEGNMEISETTKPLGFAMNRLSSFTTYRLRVNFTGDKYHAPTSIVMQFKTDETPKVGFLNPVPKAGTTTTVFTATAGLSQEKDKFAYYFHATDLAGNRVCVGGCTGYNLVHFSLKRPGTYTLSVTLYDKSGKSMIDHKVMPTPIEVKLSGSEKQFMGHLKKYFMEGDDASWSQLASDMFLVATAENPEKFETDILLGESGRELDTTSNPSEGIIWPDGQENAAATAEPLIPAPTKAPTTIEDRLRMHRLEAIALIAKGYRGIMCSSAANSQHGRNAILLLQRILTVPHIQREALLNCLFTLMCAIENAPPSCVIDVTNELPIMMASFYRHAKKSDDAGFNRERQLAQTPKPGNLVADIAVVCGKLMVRAIAMGKLDGFQYSVRFGEQGEYGHIALFAGLSADQMTLASINGEQRRIMQGPSNDELFYIMPPRFKTVFTGLPKDKRYIALYTLPNFIVKSRLQDPPSGTNLADDLYWVQMYTLSGIDGGLRPMIPTSDKPAFCMRMPVIHNREFFSAPMGLMPGMYGVRDIKRVGEVAQNKGEFFNYVYQGMRVAEYNVSKQQNWVEACHTSPSLFGATAVSTLGGEQAVGLDRAILVGSQGSLIAALATGAIVLLVAVVVGAWLIATRSETHTPGAVAGGYVERDGYGRGPLHERPVGGTEGVTNGDANVRQT